MVILDRINSLHAQIQEFLSGGGEGPGPKAGKQPGQRFFVVFSPQFILQFTEGYNGFITERTILFQGSRGSNFFQGGGGDPNVNFYRNPYNL